jgi:hypothetical protein
MQQASEHLIFVGKPDQLPPLAELSLPLPIVNDTRTFDPDAVGGSTDDGILQMIVSPWNPARAVLVVSGNTDAAVVKAGQTISTGSFATAITIEPNLSLIASVAESVDAAMMELVADERTFADLGYESVIHERQGYLEVEYEFTIPPGYVAGIESYLDIVFNHSAIIDYGRSGISIKMNDQVIGSIEFDDESTERSIDRMSIPPTTLHVGQNRLQVLIAIFPRAKCLPPNLNGIWATVWAESLLYLPLQEVGITNATFVDLRRYENLLLADPSLSNSLFILPHDKPTAWQVATDMTSYLGKQFQGEMFEAKSAFANDVPDNLRTGYNWVVVGRPSTLPVLQELGENLPLPFIPDSDVAITGGSTIEYRMPSDINLGYLQLLASPWDIDRFVLAVLGNTPTGIMEAGNALIHDSSDLAGNFAVVVQGQIRSGDTRGGPLGAELATNDMLSTTLMLSDTTETDNLPATVTVSGTNPNIVGDFEIMPDRVERAKWIFPAIITSIVLIIVLLIGVSTVALWRVIIRYREQQRFRRMYKKDTSELHGKENKENGDDHNSDLPESHYPAS